MPQYVTPQMSLLLALDIFGWLLGGAIIGVFILMVGFTWWIGYKANSRTIIRIYDPATQHESDEPVIPNPDGNYWVNEELPGNEHKKVKVPYSLNPGVTRVRKPWPGGLPRFMQRELPVSLHIRGKSPAVSYSDIVETMRNSEATAYAMMAAEETASLVNVTANIRDKLSRTNPKKLILIAIVLICAVAALSMFNLYYGNTIKGQIDLIMKASNIGK